MNEVMLSIRPGFHCHTHVRVCIWVWEGRRVGEERERVLFASVIGFSLEG